MSSTHPLGHLRAAETQLVAQIDAAAASIDTVGTHELDDALARLHASTLAAASRLDRAASIVRAMAGDALAASAAVAREIREAIEADTPFVVEAVEAVHTPTLITEFLASLKRGEPVVELVSRGTVTVGRHEPHVPRIAPEAPGRDVDPGEPDARPRRKSLQCEAGERRAGTGSTTRGEAPGAADEFIIGGLPSSAHMGDGGGPTRSKVQAVSRGGPRREEATGTPCSIGPRRGRTATARPGLHTKYIPIARPMNFPKSF